MPLYHKSRIGKLIAKGGDRYVYKYGKNSVIKFSSLSFLLGNRMNQKIMYDYSVCKKYLDSFVVETITVSNPSKRIHVEIQQFIEGTTFSIKHARNSNLQSQLREIVSKSTKMIQDGHPQIDLVGNKGMITTCLSNILVDERGKLRIIDTALLEAHSLGFIGYFIAPFVPIIRARQEYLLNLFLS